MWTGWDVVQDHGKKEKPGCSREAVVQGGLTEKKKRGVPIEPRIGGEKEQKDRSPGARRSCALAVWSGAA